jgi:hypothetical protein
MRMESLYETCTSINGMEDHVLSLFSSLNDEGCLKLQCKNMYFETGHRSGNNENRNCENDDADFTYNTYSNI